MRLKNLIVPILIILISCEKEHENGVNNSIIEKEIQTQYFFEIEKNDEYDYNEPLAYLGDTIKYVIQFKSNTKIKYIRTYIDKGNIYGKWDIYTIIDNQENNSNSIWIDKTEDTLTLTYPLTNNAQTFRNFYNMYTEYGTSEQQKARFILEYYDTLEIIRTDTLPFFKLSKLKVENHQKLFNIADKSGKCRGFSLQPYYLVKYSFSSKTNCGGGPCKLPNDTSLFMVNIPNSDYNFEIDTAITKDFISGWFAPKKNHYFVKVTNDMVYYEGGYLKKPDFESITTTWHVTNAFNNNEPKMTKIENPQVGDLYAFHYTSTFYRYGDVFGIIEVTHIENDYLTSENGGNEQDYIEFRIKYFSMEYRFKN